jgi:hypothetical protein
MSAIIGAALSPVKPRVARGWFIPDSFVDSKIRCIQGVARFLIRYITGQTAQRWGLERRLKAKTATGTVPPPTVFLLAT